MLGKVLIKMKKDNVNAQLRNHILLMSMMDGTFDGLQNELNKDKALDIATIKGVNYALFNKFGDIAGSITGYGLKSFATPELNVETFKSFMYENLGMQSMDYALRAQYDSSIVGNPNEVAQRVRANRFTVNAVQASLLDYPSLTDGIHISTTPNSLLRELFDNPLAASKYLEKDNCIYNSLGTNDNLMDTHVKNKLIFNYKATPIVDPIVRVVLNHNKYQDEAPNLFGTDIHNMRRVKPATMPYTEVSIEIESIKDLFNFHMGLIYLGFCKTFAHEINEFMGYKSPSFNINTFSSRQKRRGIPFTQFETAIQDMLRAYMELRDNSYHNFELIIKNAAKIGLLKKFNIPNPELINYKNDSFDWIPDLSMLDTEVLLNLVDKDLTMVGVAEGQLVSEDESLTKLGVIHTLDIDYESLKDIKNNYYRDRYNELIKGAVELLQGKMPFSFFDSDYEFTDKDESVLISSVSFKRATSELNGKSISSKRQKYKTRKPLELNKIPSLNRHFPKGIYARSTSSFGGINNIAKVEDGLINISHQHLLSFYKNYVGLIADYMRTKNQNVRFEDIQNEFVFEYDPLLKCFIFRNAALDGNFNVARDGWHLDANGHQGTYRTYKPATKPDNLGRATLIDMNSIEVYDENNSLDKAATSIIDIKFDLKKNEQYPLPTVTENSFDNFRVKLSELSVIEMLSIIASNQTYSRKYYNKYKQFAHVDLLNVYSYAVLSDDGSVKLDEGKVQWKKEADNNTEIQKLISKLENFDETKFLEIILPSTYWITPKFSLLSTYNNPEQYFALQAINSALSLLKQIKDTTDSAGNSVLSSNSAWMTDDGEVSFTNADNAIFDELIICKSKVHRFYYNLKSLVDDFRYKLLDTSVNNIQLPVDYMQKILFVDGDEILTLDNQSRKEMKVADVITYIISNPMFSEENIRNSIAQILRKMGINRKTDNSTTEHLYELISTGLDLYARIDTDTNKLTITTENADDDYFEALMNEGSDPMNARLETYKLCNALKDLCEGNDAVHVEFLAMKIEELRRLQAMDRIDAQKRKNDTDLNKGGNSKDSDKPSEVEIKHSKEAELIKLQKVIDNSLSTLRQIYDQHSSALLFTSFKDEIETLADRLKKTRADLRKAPQMKSYQMLKNMALDNLKLIMRLLNCNELLDLEKLNIEEHQIWNSLRTKFK